MSSPFADISAALQTAINERFGGGIRFKPKAGDNNYSKGADPDRPIKTIHGVVTHGAKVARANIRGTDTDGTPAVLVPGEIWVCAAEYAALGYALKRDDGVEVLDGDGAVKSTHTIAAVNDGDFGDKQIIIGG